MRRVILVVVLGAGCGRSTDEEAPRIEAIDPIPAEDAEADAKAEPPAEPAKAPEPIASTDPHPFTARDLLAMDRVSDPQVSPDGKTVAFTRRVTDLQAQKGRTDVWQVPVAGGPPTQLTRDPGSDHSPRWSPDGTTVYFLSTRSESSQVWAMPASGGEPRQVTDLPLPVDGLMVSPSGTHLIVALSVFVDCKDLACTEARLAQAQESPGKGQVYDQLFVRHWDTYRDGRRNHLFAIPVDGDDDPVDLGRGLDADTPSRPFGDMGEVAIHPDGKTVVFAARDAGAAEPWSTNFDLWVAPTDGTTAPRNLTQQNPAWDSHPVFSPDGNTLAYVAMVRAGYEADRFRLVLQSWPDGEPKVLTETWDRSIRDFAFSPDGKTIYATAQDLGQVSLFAIDVETGAVEKRWGDGTVGSPRPTASAVVFTKNDLGHPTELFALEPGQNEPRAITEINRDKVEAARMGEAEQFTFTGARGDTVHAYVIKPVDFDPKKRYPVAFLIHGGPQGSFGNRFHYRWNPQTYAGAGYASIMIDFHGSTGYGQAFTDAIRDDWGGKPLEDLQKGLAAALDRHPWLDGDRACALGASYGGFMVNWIAGKWPDRFRCLVNHDGVFDQRMMYFATEELWFPEWEHGGPYYENPKAHEKHNPAAHVQKWKTPMLVVHGSLDFRVPETQGLGAFTALQRQGIPSRYLRFESENHWVLRPGNSEQWHAEVLRWLDQWTAPKAP